MSVITFQGKLIASGAKLAGYRGAETPASFGDPAAEFRALLEGRAVFDMSWQGKLIFSGRDRVRWLNGMVTNNIRDLGAGRGVYSFLLTPQGHNQGDLVAYNRGDYLLAITDREQAPKITTLLQRYIIMDQVEIEEISDKLGAIGVAGPESGEVLSRLGLDVSRLELGQVVDTVASDVGISVARPTHPHWDGYEIWLAPGNVDRIWDALTGAGATPAGSDALEMYRIARGVPRYGIDLRQRDLPQETGQQHALSFTKGCYIGQEIVERVRARGNVHRTFVGFEVQGEASPHSTSDGCAGGPETPPPGTKVRAGDKDVGEITSAARVPFTGGTRTLALGYLRREAAGTGITVQVGERNAIVRALPF
jgi:folate-binding protein YgfZ